MTAPETFLTSEQTVAMALDRGDDLMLAVLAATMGMADNGIKLASLNGSPTGNGEANLFFLYLGLVLAARQPTFAGAVLEDFAQNPDLDRLLGIIAAESARIWDIHR